MKLKRKFSIAGIKWRKVLVISAWITSIAAVMITMGFVRSEKRATVCTGIDINIADDDGLEFVTGKDVFDVLGSSRKNPLGKRLVDINTGMLENLINANPWVAGAEVFSTIDGKLHIDIVQRKPLIRIINYKDEHFYIDDKGTFMPISGNYTAHIVAASGYIFDTYAERKIYQVNEVVNDTLFKKPMINQLFELAGFISKDTFWNAQVEQIYVNQDQEIEVIPVVGDHVILFGSTRDMKEKFDKLMIFYKEGLSKTGWNQYSAINLKYNNQVVCTRRETKKTK